MTICTFGKKIREKQKFSTPLKFQTDPFSIHFFVPISFRGSRFFWVPSPHIRTRMRVSVKI